MTTTLSADAVLLPHRRQPCGLVQMRAMAYGAVPIAHATGGLRDTVIDATAAHLKAGTATGFCFSDPTPEGLKGAIEQALTFRTERRHDWRKLMLNGMSRDFSWDDPAAEYETLYRSFFSS